MFCHKCGTKIADDATFCHKCGIKVVTYAGSPTEELNAKTMKDIDLFVTSKVDSGFSSPVMNSQELDVNIDSIKMGKLLFDKTIAYKIAPGQHHIILGPAHIWIDTPEGSGPVHLTIQSIAQEEGALKHQLICEPSHLVIPAPQNDSVELGDPVQCRNSYSQEQYQVAKPEVAVCHRCGTEIDKNVEFCYKCGAKIRYKEHEPRPSYLEIVENRNESTSTGIQPRKRLECPNCHSSDLVPVSETKTDISGGGYRAGKGCCGWILLGPLGLLCGLCGTGIKSKSKTITFWMCRDCGNKFRSPRDIETEKLSENANDCFALLKGAGIIYIAGNLLNDYNLKIIGIPNWIYIMLGAIGITLGVIWGLGLAFEKIWNDIAYMDDADEKGFFHNFLAGAVGFFIIFLVTFMGGILSAGVEIRFFWIPAWIYILVGVLGMIVSVIVMIFSWRMGLNDEKAEKFDAKYGSLFEKAVRKIKRK